MFLFTIKKAVPVTETHFEIIHKFMHIEYVIPGFSKTPSFFQKNPGFQKTVLFQKTWVFKNPVLFQKNPGFQKLRPFSSETRVFKAHSSYASILKCLSITGESLMFG